MISALSRAAHARCTIAHKTASRIVMCAFSRDVHALNTQGIADTACRRERQGARATAPRRAHAFQLPHNSIDTADSHLISVPRTLEFSARAMP